MTEPVVVVGGSLGGLAAAARLAKLGHPVVLVDAARTLRWDGVPAASPLVELPAAWRDLFRKSGRILDAALARQRRELTTAPRVHHRFADGTELAWPTDRAEQLAVLTHTMGGAAAAAWRELVDGLDDTWQAVRRLDVESELDADDLTTRSLLADPRTIEDAAHGLPDPRLGELALDIARQVGSDPAETPSWLLSRLSVRRTFGRWVVTDGDGVVQPAETLTEALLDRLDERGVLVRTDVTATAIGAGRVDTTDGSLAAAAVVSAVSPWTHATLVGRPLLDVGRRRRLGPLRIPRRPTSLPRALAPTVSRHAPTPDAPLVVVDHTSTGPRVTFSIAGTTIVHDHTTPEQPRGGQESGVPAWAGTETWRSLPRLRDDVLGVYYAGSGALAGAEPWGRLLIGGLATYAVHEQLTGEDARPTNKAFRRG